jgi:hypothetical protein
MLLAAAFAQGACGDDSGSDGGPAPFPDDYRTLYTEVRDCRFSLEHDLKYIRVFASPDAVDAYLTRATSIPVGAILVKEQYGDSDTVCATLVDYAVMVRSAQDMEISTDWEFLHVSGQHRIVREDVGKCVTCHVDCGVEPDGYEGTCAAP